MAYPSDLTPEQWALVEALFRTGNYGKKRKHTKKRLLEAVLYIVKTGCQWRFLPKDFPPYKTVYSFYRRAMQRGIWEQMMALLVEYDRKQANRNFEPSCAIIDSQSVKTVYAQENRGFDGGKKNQGTQKTYCN